MIADLKPYPAYKDSGLSWLGKVPEHWEVLRGKMLFRCVDVRSSTGEEELLTVSSKRGVIPRRSATVTMFKAESYSGYKLCWPGDLVINSLWAWAGGLGVSQHHGIISTAYGVYRLQPSYANYSDYIHTLVRSSQFQWELQVRSKGIWTSRLQLTDEAFLDAPLSIPPDNEQYAIVRFISHADQRIARYIQAKRRLVGLLNEQRQAIVHRAVARGIRPEVHVSASGVSWLGDKPDDWKVTRLKFVASHIVDCLHATPRYEDGGAYPAIRTADVEPGHLKVESAKRVSEEQYLLWSSRLTPQEDDIVYTREGERFGLAAVVPARSPLCISQRMMVFRIRDGHSPQFFMWQLNAPHVYAQASQDVMGATSPHVNVDTIRNYSVLVPPREEQAEIADWIGAQVRPIDASIQRTNQEISLIREYRIRLVTDVVLGKLDVREAAAALPDEPEEVAAPDAAELLEGEEAEDEALEEVGVEAGP